MGQRAWAALYLGVPASPEGGLIKREWLDTWRLPAPPLRPVATVVGVDPSDSGEGDACGLIAASITADGVVAVISDVSAPMTSDQWARAAVELALDTGASEISVESYSENYFSTTSPQFGHQPLHTRPATAWLRTAHSSRNAPLAASSRQLRRARRPPTVLCAHETPGRLCAAAAHGSSGRSSL